MPIQKTITAYAFSELNEKAKEKAREWMRNSIMDNIDWATPITEGAKEDGVIITAWDATQGTASGHTEEGPLSVAQKIQDGHGEGTKTRELAEIFLNERDAAINTEGEDLDKLLDPIDTRFFHDLLKLYGRFYKDYFEERLKDESIDEDIEANEYLFTEKGSRTIVL